MHKNTTENVNFIINYKLPFDYEEILYNFEISFEKLSRRLLLRCAIRAERSIISIAKRSTNIKKGGNLVLITKNKKNPKQQEQ